MNYRLIINFLICYLSYNLYITKCSALFLYFASKLNSVILNYFSVKPVSLIYYQSTVILFLEPLLIPDMNFAMVASNFVEPYFSFFLKLLEIFLQEYVTLSTYFHGICPPPPAQKKQSWYNLYCLVMLPFLLIGWITYANIFLFCFKLGFFCGD